MNLVLREFKKYKDSVYPKGAPEMQIKEVEQAFIMGAFTGLNIVIDARDKNPNRIEDEMNKLYKFFREYRNERVSALMKDQIINKVT